MDRVRFPGQSLRCDGEIGLSALMRRQRQAQLSIPPIAEIFAATNFNLPRSDRSQ